jgi:hypothetical protein
MSRPGEQSRLPYRNQEAAGMAGPRAFYLPDPSQRNPQKLLDIARAKLQQGDPSMALQVRCVITLRTLNAF